MKLSVGLALGLSTVFGVVLGYCLSLSGTHFDDEAEPIPFHVMQTQTQLQAELQSLKAQNADLSHRLKLQVMDSTSNSKTNSEQKKVEYEDLSLRQTMYRINTRYWLSNKDKWPINSLNVLEKFVTFVPWHGGFNNIRMSLEMALAVSHSLERTLVLPPVFKLYLRGQSSLMDYFDLDDLKKGFSVITYDEFLDVYPDFRSAQSKHELPDHKAHGNVDRYYTGLLDLPKGTVVSFDKERVGSAIGMEFMFCIPNCPTKNEIKLRGASKIDTKSMEDELAWFKNWKKGSRVLVNADDEDMISAKIIHFPPKLLGHFYTMVYFRDPKQYQNLLRLMKDHLHFKEEMFEFAERVITKLGDFKFSCLHIRRNEFQFEDVRIDAEKITSNIEGIFDEDEKIYVATDELSKDGEANKKHVDFNPLAMAKKNDHSWFRALFERYGRENVFFLDDFFENDLKDAPSIWIGSIEEIICSRSKTFVGTRLSTFSGYINRLRGYMDDVGQNLVLDVQANYPYDYFHFNEGPSWSLYPHHSYGGGHPSWSKEYPEAWFGVFEPV